jgi:DNA-binding Xre family transcriptional regulator
MIIIRSKVEEMMMKNNVGFNELQRRTKMSPSHLSSIVTGKNKRLSMYTADKISKALKCKITDLYEGIK